MLAAIPYTTFPTIELGPLNLRTFGLMVALGVLLGAWIAAAYGERFGVARDETYRVATWMVLAGIVGSRLTWAATHTDQIENPVDVIAIWEGGIQFSGGFICALVVGLPLFRQWSRVLRWKLLDGYALGFSLGLGIGRIGCYAVGEHFGRTTDFFLASRYDGGDVREPLLGDVPLVPGTTFHNTSLYEFIYMMVLFALLGALVVRAGRRGRALAPATLVGVFTLCYGVARLISDSFRVNDERVAGLTGAQWMCLVMIPIGVVILWKVRPRLAALDAAGEGLAVTGPDEPAAPAARGEAGATAGDRVGGEAEDGGTAGGAGTGTAAGEADDAASGEPAAGRAGTGDDAGGGARAGRRKARRAGKREGTSAGGDETAEAPGEGEGERDGEDSERWRTAASRMSALLGRSPASAESTGAPGGADGADDETP